MEKWPTFADKCTNALNKCTFPKAIFCFLIQISSLAPKPHLKLYQQWLKYMMTSSNGNILRITGSEFTGHRWIPRTKASDAELCFLCVWINGWVNNREAGDLKRHRAHYDISVMNWLVPIRQQTIIWGRGSYMRHNPGLKKLTLMPLRLMSVWDLSFISDTGTAYCFHP